jgi:hypothetical protein
MEPGKVKEVSHAFVGVGQLQDPTLAAHGGVTTVAAGIRRLLSATDGGMPFVTPALAPYGKEWAK